MYFTVQWRKYFVFSRVGTAWLLPVVRPPQWRWQGLRSQPTNIQYSNFRNLPFEISSSIKRHRGSFFNSPPEFTESHLERKWVLDCRPPWSEKIKRSDELHLEKLESRGASGGRGAIWGPENYIHAQKMGGKQSAHFFGGGGILKNLWLDPNQLGATLP